MLLCLSLGCTLEHETLHADHSVCDEVDEDSETSSEEDDWCCREGDQEEKLNRLFEHSQTPSNSDKYKIVSIILS